jgi:HEAT repeat protein
MRGYVVVCAVVGVSLGTWAGALPGSSDKETNSERIARLIKQLGDDEFEKREAASKALELIGEPALALLRRAARSSDDAEVRKRAECALRAIKLRADAAKTTVELCFFAEHAPKEIEPNTRVDLMFVTSMNKAKAGEVSYSSKRVLQDIEVVFVKRQERPADLEKAVLVRLLVTKEQAETIKKLQAQNSADPGVKKQSETTWPMRLEPTRSTKE